MAHSRRVSNGVVSPLFALKISLVIVFAISLFFFVKLSIPHISNLLSVALPQIWAVFLAWLAPPYLFITVHLIIFVIWKLSDQKPSRDQLGAPQQDQPIVKLKKQLSREISAEILRNATPDDRWAPSGEPAVPKQIFRGEISPEISREEPGNLQWAPREEQPLPKHRLCRETSPKNSLDVSHRVSRSDESCLTEEKSDEKSTASSHLEMRRSEKPQLAPQREIVGREEREQEESVVMEEGEVDDDSMDATWKAIMEKTPRPAVATTSQARERETSVGADEMNRRFEDFIRKSRDQIRLQVEEPSRLHGRLAMANAAF